MRREGGRVGIEFVSLAGVKIQKKSKLKSFSLVYNVINEWEGGSGNE
jgi:hypothetical protein